ncbi:MAG: hypothetical protein HQ536_03980 [Parcubacteria group bacterium]|nr:hypothetical protein [Parcubacteria group bacterium]
MGLESFVTAISFFKEFMGLGKQLINLMPDSPKKEDALIKLKDAEEKLKAAEIESAQKLGHKICQCTWPSQIMLLDHSKKVFKCPNPKCDNEITAKRKKWPLNSIGNPLP